jgi:GAF domain-containing protein
VEGLTLDRATWIAQTLVELADNLVDDFDLVELLAMLVQRSVDILDGADAGIVLADEDGVLHVMASSSERVHAIELYEVRNDEGPCREAYLTGEPVVSTLLDGPGNERWPLFAELARALGFRTALALPMRLRDDRIGALNILLTHDRAPSEAELRLTQALADTATIAIIQHRTVERSSEMADQLRRALSTRVVIEQAKGVLAERAGIHVGEAFQRMRDDARATNRPLREVAETVLAGDYPLDRDAGRG